MILNDVQKKTIRLMDVGDRVTFGGVAAGMDDRYEVTRLTEKEFKVGKYALMICLDVDHVGSPEEVISFIEGRVPDMSDNLDEKVMTVKDLASYLEKLPQDAELFYYAGHGGFLSLDNLKEVSSYFKLSSDGRTLLIDAVRYEEEKEDRIAQGKEWTDI